MRETRNKYRIPVRKPIGKSRRRWRITLEGLVVRIRGEWNWLKIVSKGVLRY
jgi:hypothetical protein